jgi:peptidoglycan/LPS O-acetylase OafA/YrhL
MTNVNKKNTYYPALDGLRVFSFFIVFLFHVPLDYLNLGWGGVNIFFALSGFLITEILIKTKEKKSFFSTFYWRRSLRIFPIYYLLVIFILLVFLIKKRYLPDATFGLLSYTSNYFYSNLNDEYVFMLHHTWTLAIEEQFYLIWPLVIYFLPTRYLLGTSFLFILLSMGYRTLSVFNPAISFVHLPAQIDSLVLGAVVAILKVKGNIHKGNFKLYRNSAIVIGTLGIVLVFFVLAKQNSITIMQTYAEFGKSVDYTKSIIGIHTFFFIAVFSIGLILNCLYANNLLNKIFSHSVMVHLGKISYGLYLYHYPVLAVTRFFVPNKIALFFIALIVTILISEISYYTIEKYFRDVKEKFKYT